MLGLVGLCFLKLFFVLKNKENIDNIFVFQFFTVKKKHIKH